MITEYNHKKRNLFSGPHVAGLILILAGAFAIISPYIMDSGSTVVKSLIVGIIAIVLGILVVSSYSGTLIDFSGHRVKEYTAVAGVKIGNWESLPELLSIVVKQHNFKARSASNGITPTFVRGISEFKIYLLNTSGSSAIKLTYYSDKKAKEASEILAYNFRVPLDSSL